MSDLTKQALREKFRVLRSSLSPTRKIQAELNAVSHFIKQPCFDNSEHIAGYFALPAEFNLQGIIGNILSNNKHCYLPKLHDNALTFVSYDKNTVLTKNKFGILEPENGIAIPLVQLNLVLVPLIAFDRFGHRLGTGGGYYDRTFADQKQLPFFVGVGFSFQESEKIPHDKWDLTLNAVLTEKEFIYIKG